MRTDETANEKIPFVVPFERNFDTWSYVHLLGAYFLSDFFGAWWVGFGGTAVWELLDSCFWSIIGTKAKRVRFNYKYKESTFIYKFVHFLDSNVFDRRGISCGDLLCGTIGTFMWVLKTNLL